MKTYILVLSRIVYVWNNCSLVWMGADSCDTVINFSSYHRFPCIRVNCVYYVPNKIFLVLLTLFTVNFPFSQVRQSLEALSGVILNDMAQTGTMNLNVEVPKELFS